MKCGQFLKRYLHTGSPLRGKLAVKDEHHPLVAVITVCPRRLPAHNLLNAVCSVHVQCPLKSDTTDSCEHVHSPLQPHPPDSCLPVHCLLSHTQQTAVYCAHVYCPPADTQQTAVYMFTAPLQTHTTDSCYCAHVSCPHAHTHTQ